MFYLKLKKANNWSEIAISNQEKQIKVINIVKIFSFLFIYFLILITLHKKYLFLDFNFFMQWCNLQIRFWLCIYYPERLSCIALFCIFNTNSCLWVTFFLIGYNNLIFYNYAAFMRRIHFFLKITFRFTLYFIQECKIKCI